MIALWLTLAQAAEVVFVVSGAALEDEFAAELQLADPSLVVLRQEAGEGWAALSAADQAERVRGWVREREAEAALWLTVPPEVHVWVPSADRDLSMAVRASTEAPAGELAVVALQHLESMGWAEPAPARPMLPPEDAVPLPVSVAVASIGAGFEATGDVGPDSAGPRLGFRARGSGEAGVVVPWAELGLRVGVVDRTELDLRGDVEVALTGGLWARWRGLGPTLGLRGSRRGLGWSDGGRASATWWDAALVPGVRVQPGAGSLRPVFWGELPLGLRDRVWRDDQAVAMRVSAVQWAAGLGLSGVFWKVDGS